MEQDRTWTLFALKLTGKATPEEWAELRQLIDGKPEVSLHLQALTNFWHQHSIYDRERIEKAMKKIADGYENKTAVNLKSNDNRLSNTQTIMGEMRSDHRSFMKRIKDFFNRIIK